MRIRRIIMPETAKRGEVITIRALIVHPMIPGHNAGGTSSVPRRIIQSFAVSYDGVEIFSATLGPGIAANPLVEFTTVATRSGELVFTWTETTGEKAVERRSLTVSPA